MTDYNTQALNDHLDREDKNIRAYEKHKHNARMRLKERYIENFTFKDEWFLEALCSIDEYVGYAFALAWDRDHFEAQGFLAGQAFDTAISNYINFYLDDEIEKLIEQEAF